MHDSKDLSSTPSEKDVCEEWAKSTTSRIDLREMLGESQKCIELFQKIKVRSDRDQEVIKRQVMGKLKQI